MIFFLTMRAVFFPADLYWMLQVGELVFQILIPGCLGGHVCLGPAGACIVREGLAGAHWEHQQPLAIDPGCLRLLGYLLAWSFDHSYGDAACCWVLRRIPDGKNAPVCEGGKIRS